MSVLTSLQEKQKMVIPDITCKAQIKVTCIMSLRTQNMNLMTGMKALTHYRFCN